MEDRSVPDIHRRMAAFKQHILFSSLAGAGYAVALTSTGLAWPHAALAGLLCGGAGMLPRPGQ